MPQGQNRRLRSPPLEPNSSCNICYFAACKCESQSYFSRAIEDFHESTSIRAGREQCPRRCRFRWSGPRNRRVRFCRRGAHWSVIVFPRANGAWNGVHATNPSKSKQPEIPGIGHKFRVHAHRYGCIIITGNGSLACSGVCMPRSRASSGSRLQLLSHL